MNRSFALLCVVAAAAAVPAQAGPKKQLEVVVETDGKKYRAVRKRVIDGEGSMVYRRPAREGFLRVESVDAAGRTLQARSVPDPTHVFYDYLDPADAGAGRLKGGVAKAKKAELVVALPYAEGAKRLRIMRHKKKNRNHTAHPPASETELEQEASLDLTGVPE